MIILSVIIGYVLGVMPFLFFYAINRKLEKPIKNKDESIPENLTGEIINEWLNGEKPKEDEEKQTTPKMMYNEILSGVANGGE